METEKKLLKYSDEEKKQLIEEFYKNKETLELNFLINDKPIPYARARAGRHGFYNPKEKEKKQYKHLCLLQVTEDNWKILSDLMNNEESEYYVTIIGDFYVPIPKSDSIKTTILKEEKAILPTVRNGDIDNYIKFTLDALHDVIYTDDKRVIHIEAHKYYSIKPRSEITVKLEIIKK